MATRLATRVVVATVVSAAMGGVLAALLSAFGIDRLVENHSDQRLANAAATLGAELDEDDDDGESLLEIVADEQAELETSGIRLAVFDGRRRVAGDVRVPWTTPASCATHADVSPEARGKRACGHAHRKLVLVAAQTSDQAALRWLYLLAAASAALIGGGAGALGSTLLTRWAVRPLTELTAALRAMPPRPTTASARDLGEPSNCEEIEAIRSAIAELIRRIDGLLSQAQRFAADAAHELRTPLTTIRGELDLILEERASGLEAEALRRVRDRTAQLGELVERLLVLAAPLGEQQHTFEAVALADVLHEVVTELPASDRLRLDLQLTDEGLIRGEPMLLRSLFVNAVQNALKFSGDERVTVELREAPEQGLVSIEVRDNGQGIPPAQRERVFEPFYRATPHLGPGFGLGLPLVGHIARAHGGSAEFISAERGACLRIVLPRWSPRRLPDHDR